MNCFHASLILKWSNLDAANVLIFKAYNITIRNNSYATKTHRRASLQRVPLDTSLYFPVEETYQSIAGYRRVPSAVHIRIRLAVEAVGLTVVEKDFSNPSNSMLYHHSSVKRSSAYSVIPTATCLYCKVRLHLNNSSGTLELWRLLKSQFTHLYLNVRIVESLCPSSSSFWKLLPVQL